MILPLFCSLHSHKGNVLFFISAGHLKFKMGNWDRHACSRMGGQEENDVTLTVHVISVLSATTCSKAFQSLYLKVKMVKSNYL